jgi:hypothetical protein
MVTHCLAMGYDDIKQALEKAGFSAYRREENGTLICSATHWPSVPQSANSFWIAERGNDWFIATWSPHIYRVGDSARVSELCVAVLNGCPKPAQYDFDDQIKKRFNLVEIDPDEFPDN